MRLSAKASCICLALAAVSGSSANDALPLGVRVAGQVQATFDEALSVPLELPEARLLTLHTAVSNWVVLDRLVVDIWMPPEAPAGVQALAHVIDWDGLWHQVLLPDRLAAGSTNQVTIDVSAAATGWEPLGHHGAWHRRALMEPREVGLRLFGGGAYTGACIVVSATGLARPDTAPPVIRHVRANDAFPPVYGQYELRFTLPDRYANPFDPREVSVDAEIRLPSGAVDTVPGFYFQDFFRTISPAGETILPQGRPEWRLRYSPREEGAHALTLRVRDRHGEGSWGPVRFVAGPRRRAGIVRVSARDPRFFEYSRGDPYFPIGHNIRSPFDTRMDDQFPNRFRHPEGSAAYRRYFRDMQAAGANLVQIWLSAWSLGLEWSPTHRGYHGIGQYNLMHAWELDQVLQLADRHGLNVNLVLNHHGRLSNFCDPEWHHNPFNIARGGYLSEPMAWFEDERALREFEQQLRYLVARYAWHANLFAWQLWSELDLAGMTGHDRPHHDPRVIAWHRRMARYLTSLDYHTRMISTHISTDYRRQNPEMISLPEMSLVAVNAYHGSRDPLQVVRLQVETAAFNNLFGKPIMITEFGGSPMAAALGQLRREVHAALWSSVASATAGTPLFWWWMVIEEENFYPMYRAVSRFMEGEDRRDPALLPTPVRVVDADGQPLAAERVDGVLLASPRQAFGWLFAGPPRFSLLDPEGAPEHRDLQVVLAGEDGAIYLVEFWDTVQGEVIARQDARARHGVLMAPVPPFARDIAFKVKRQPVPDVAP